MDNEILDGDTLTINYITSGGKGCMKLYLPEFYKKYKSPDIAWTKKLLRLVVDLSPDSEKIRTLLWEWLTERFHEVCLNPEDETYQKNMAKAYADARQAATDIKPKIADTEKIVARMQQAVKGLPKKAPQREMLKKVKEELKDHKSKLRSYEREIKDIPRYVEQNKRDYEKWLTLLNVVSGGC